MPAEDPRDQYAGPNLRFEVPFDLEHAPVSLNGDGREAFLLTLPLSFTIRANKRGVSMQKDGGDVTLEDTRKLKD